MVLTDEQQSVVHSFVSGGNVCVKAVPGAGKTKLLVDTCEQASGPCLLLAYNTQLAADVQDALERAGLLSKVLCCTFHALCTRYIAPARDDAELLRAVEAAEEGLQKIDPPADVHFVLVDECQDVRVLYLRLLRVLKLGPPFHPTLLVGDPMQLIYDFDVDHPANEETISSPDVTFPGTTWLQCTLSWSFRLTRPMAGLVHGCFGVDVFPFRDGPPVDFRVVNAFQMFSALQDVLMSPDAANECMVLVHRRRGNMALCKLLNELSSRQVLVHVHGVDADDAAAKKGKLKCITWWAAKGMQCDTAIVIVPRFAAKNPLYVALTRAVRRLVVVMESSEINRCVIRAFRTLPHGSFQTNAAALSALSAPDHDEDSFCVQPHFAPRAGVVRSLDTWRPPRRTMLDTCSIDMVHEGSPFSDSSRAPVMTFRVAVILCEYHATGRVRAVEDILHPTRLTREAAANALRLGFTSRHVSPNTPSDSLLPSDLTELTKEAYRRLPSLDAAAKLSLAVESWNSFHHVMRQLLPVEPWCFSEAIQCAVGNAQRFIPASTQQGVEFDVRLRMERQEQLWAARAHVVTREAVYHLVCGDKESGPSEETIGHAAVRASLHGSARCFVVDLLYGWAAEVNVVQPEVLLDCFDEIRQN